MATYVGHSLMGLIIARVMTVFNPVCSLFCVIFANFPDLPVKGWGHDKYNISHSLLILLIISLILGLFDMKTGIIALVCLVSHIILDACYEKGEGIRCFYPFSNKPLKIMRVLKHMDTKEPFGRESLMAYLLELLIFVPILILIILL